MEPRTSRKSGFTRLELVVVVVIILVLASMLLPSLRVSRAKPSRIACINNLKQIGIAYRIWSNDNGDKFPDEVPQSRGGWSNLLSSTKAHEYAWTNYAVMSSELGQTTKLLVCPDDERKAAITFSNLLNINVSYFVGAGADDNFPQALLGGDRNLSPGNTPHDDYGFSPSDGKGKDVTIKGPVCWSLKMHSSGNSSGAGNILMGDGSVQQVTSGNLNLNWLKPAMVAYTNVPGAPGSTGGIRLIFP